jgi:protein SCO1/2
LDKVSFSLTDTDGEPFDFRKETDGKIALLFFGYTYCPDICPMHMATLSTAMEDLEPEVREQVRVVFVSVDPERDTPERLAQWLTAFDSSFIGVRGTLEEVSQALAFYRYPSPETSGEEVGYTVGHPALVYAFTPDNLGRAMYGVETPKAVWVHDLNLMAWHRWESPSVEESGPSSGESPASEEVMASVGSLQVLDAYVPRPPAGETAALYLTIRNAGVVSDTLLGFATEASRSTSLHDMVMSDGVMRMVPMAGGLALPGGASVTLAPGGRHGMLEGLLMELEPDSGVDLTLRFAQAGELSVTARIIRYEDMVR